MPADAPLFDAVVAILADGARPDVMRRLASEGHLPTFKTHFLDRNGMATAASVFPTVSGPAHLPLLCGVHPATANLPGIRWAERPQGNGGFWGRTRSYMSPGRAAKLQRDIPAQVTTLFAHIPGMADVNTWFVRGCPGKARRTRFSKAGAFLRSLSTKDWYSSDQQAEHATVKALEAGFTSVHAVFPAIDELGHRCGPLSDESLEAYKRFDLRLSHVVDALVRLGRLNRTLLLVTSDHGQTGTHTHVSLEDVVEDVIPQTVSYPRLWRHSRRPHAAVMVSGNAMANIYLRGETNWDTRPDLEKPGTPGFDLRQRLLEHEGIDQLLYRQADDVLVLANRHGKLKIVVPAFEGAEPPHLHVSVEGQNPLGEATPLGNVSRLQGLQGLQDANYTDVAWQVWNFYRSSRAGDLVVCAQSGFDLRERFEYQPHNGSHGTLHRDHMLVPAAINAQWPQGALLSSVDLFPTILDALGKPIPAGLDGHAHKLTA